MSKIVIKNGEISGSSQITIKSPIVLDNTFIRKTRTVTGSCDVLKTDNILLVDATTSDVFITLPNAASCSIGTEFVIKQIDNSEYEVYINCSFGNKIDNDDSYSLFNQNDVATIICGDSQNWYTI